MTQYVRKNIHALLAVSLSTKQSFKAAVPCVMVPFIGVEAGSSSSFTLR